jgi:hypothetical protein
MKLKRIKIIFKGELFMVATSKYLLPNLKFYKPNKLQRLSEKVEQETDKRAMNFSENRLERSLDFLKSGRPLRRSYCKVIAYHLAALKHDKDQKFLYDKFIFKAKEFFNEVGKYYYHLKALLSSFYTEFMDKKIFKLIKLIVKNNTQWKSEMDFTKQLLIKSNSAKDYFVQTLNQIKHYNSLDEIESFREKLFMKNNSSLLESLIFNWIQEEIDKGIEKINNEFYKTLLNKYLASEKKKEVFEKILLSQKEINNFDFISNEVEDWFNLIGETLGDPYGSNSAKWLTIDEEARDIFKKWKVHKNITYVFGEISGDQRRLDFWKEYSDYFYRVEYFEEYAKAILMESRDHLFIEFAGGGALYMYEKEDRNIQQIIDNVDNHSRTKMVSDELKDPSEILCKERLIHNSRDWESKFTRRFSTYGYRPNKEGKRDQNDNDQFSVNEERHTN